MRRKCLCTGCIVWLLHFVIPASANGYKGTTTIDLTSLRFSGIGTTFTPQMKLIETPERRTSIV